MAQVLRHSVPLSCAPLSQNGCYGLVFLAAFWTVILLDSLDTGLAHLGRILLSTHVECAVGRALLVGQQALFNSLNHGAVNGVFTVNTTLTQLKLKLKNY